MSNVGFIVFVLAVLYAVAGNIFVYVWLARADVPMRMMLVGWPGYLIQRCYETGRPRLARFSASTLAAWFLALISIPFWNSQ